MTIHKLAEAMVEAHGKKLRFINISADDVLLYKGEPRLYPIDFSSWLAAAAHAEGALAMAIDMLAYVAPEYIHKRTERDLSTSEAERIETSNLADQYSLAMVALTMPEGGSPVEINSVGDIARLLEFQRDPSKSRGADHPS